MKKQEQAYNALEAISRFPDENLQNWLTKPYILSQALKRSFGAISVEVVSQAFGEALPDEIALLEIPTNEQAFIRQVYLVAGGQRRTYGRVVIPLRTYQYYEEKFEGLENKPLGETLLYNNPDVTRSEFEFSFVYLLSEEGHWARRSVFWLKEYPLLVTELFLPGLPEYVPAD